MKYIKLLVLIAVIAAARLCVLADSNDGKLFPYPVVPEEKVSLSERCNYLVHHFWDRCNIKQSFSSQNKLDEAFGDWISFMPYATADTVHMAIDNFLKQLKGQDKNLPILGNIAQKWLYCDSAEYLSEELYYPFAKALAENKKMPSHLKAKYAAQEMKLRNSKVNDIATDFTITQPISGNVQFAEITAPNILLFFNDPDCADCTLARIRLSADFNANQLIEKGLLKIVSVYPGESTDEEWLKATSKYPENWIVGASADVDKIYTIDPLPAIYYMDSSHKILGKDLIVDNILNAIRILNNNTAK